VSLFPGVSYITQDKKDKLEKKAKKKGKDSKEILRGSPALTPGASTLLDCRGLEVFDLTDYSML